MDFRLDPTFLQSTLFAARMVFRETVRREGGVMFRLEPSFITGLADDFPACTPRACFRVDFHFLGRHKPP
mgnify:CR=1 FL=1